MAPHDWEKSRRVIFAVGRAKGTLPATILTLGNECWRCLQPLYRDVPHLCAIPEPEADEPQPAA